jgi:hypothetical protein
MCGCCALAISWLCKSHRYMRLCPGLREQLRSRLCFVFWILLSAYWVSSLALEVPAFSLAEAAGRSQARAARRNHGRRHQQQCSNEQQSPVVYFKILEYCHRTSRRVRESVATWQIAKTYAKPILLVFGGLSAYSPYTMEQRKLSTDQGRPRAKRRSIFSIS